MAMTPARDVEFKRFFVKLLNNLISGKLNSYCISSAVVISAPCATAAP